MTGRKSGNIVLPYTNLYKHINMEIKLEMKRVGVSDSESCPATKFGSKWIKLFESFIVFTIEKSLGKKYNENANQSVGNSLEV